MGFREIEIKKEYRTLGDNVIKDFYIPVLSNAKLYKRAVGFFSSTALIELSKGIMGLIRNKGKILLIASPRLQEDDVIAMNMGYKEKSKIIEGAILREFYEPITIFEEERLNLLANLIAEGILEIKIAFTQNSKGIGIYHEKLGLIYDEDENVIAFTGSMNETNTAFNYNYETIDVFCSWTGDEERVSNKKSSFEILWNDYEPNMLIMDFPEAAKRKLQQYRRDKVNYDIDVEEFMGDEVACTAQAGIPQIPNSLELHTYQIQAIDSWQEAGYRGIFDMATGTGKTYTGLGAAVRLSDSLKQRLAIIIVCPYQHLVEQWVEDIELFNMNPIIAYSTSKQRNWKEKLKNAVIDFNIGIKSNLCIVTTNATYTSTEIQKRISEIQENIMILIDEAHNFGADRLSKYLRQDIKYRLALSATLERHNDIEGTEKLLNYFGEKNIEYTLEKAILEEKLTPYYYYPIIVCLNEEELEKYQELSRKIIKCCQFKKDGSIKISKAAEILLIERARVVAGATQKIDKLRELMLDYTTDSHLLVYCGATTIKDSTYKEGVVEEYEARQIDVVTKLLGKELNMAVSQFTAQESAEERENLKREFARGKSIQALIAIRCLDEGVNIPNIQTAFILASSTNPKEYIQRRGRVLRKAPGKEKATIYDFVTLPRSLEDIVYATEEDLKMDRALVKREIERVKNFALIAENSSMSDRLIEEIEDLYSINIYGGKENEL